MTKYSITIGNNATSTQDRRNIPVNEGDEVVEGSCIIVLEAMKMENEILAPVSGKVIAVRFGPGDKVSAGDILAIIG